MAREISRTFRKEFKDFEIVIEDDFGVQRPFYVSLVGERCAGCGRARNEIAPDVDAEVKALLDGHHEDARKVIGVLERSGVQAVDGIAVQKIKAGLPGAGEIAKG